MADRTRTLDEILDDARREPPVLSLEEAEMLIAEGRPAAPGITGTGLTWKGALMAALMLTGAAIVALVLSTSTDGNDNRTATADYAERVTEQGAAAPDAAPPAAALLDTATPHTVPAPTQSPSTAAATHRQERAGLDEPATTGRKRPWGYHFVTGQLLRYRYVIEESNPGANDIYTQTRMVEVLVERVADDGTATITQKVLDEQLDQRGRPELPDNIVLVNVFQHPKSIRATITPLGTVIVLEVTSVTETRNAGHFVNEVFPVLPAPIIMERSTLSDSTSKRYEMARIDEEGELTLVPVVGTTQSTWTLTEPREIEGKEMIVMMTNTRGTSVIADEPEPSMSATLDELYIRTADGIPERGSSITTHHEPGGSGSSRRTTLELLTEDLTDVDRDRPLR